MRGKTTCYMHGGATPRGFGLPQTKHGRYSKSIPARLSESYAEVLADARKLELEGELAVVVARSREILASLNSGDSGPWRLRLRRHKRAEEKARRDGDAGAAADHLNEIMRMIEEGAPDGERWQEWTENTEQLRRLAESERKRKIEETQTANIEEVVGLVTAFEAAVREVITRDAAEGAVPEDKANRILRVIGREIDALLDWPGAN